MAAPRDDLTAGPTPGLDAVARVAGVDRTAFDDDPRTVLPALRTAIGEVLEVALGLGAADPVVREQSEVRRHDLQDQIGLDRTMRPWQDAVMDHLDHLIELVHLADRSP
jgi:hypothetical protein